MANRNVLVDTGRNNDRLAKWKWAQLRRWKRRGEPLPHHPGVSRGKKEDPAKYPHQLVRGARTTMSTSRR